MSKANGDRADHSAAAGHVIAQAWFREGYAAEALDQWEPAAQAYFEAFRLDADNPAFSQVLY